MTESVREVLERSPVARTTATLDLGAGREVTIWENHCDRVVYETPRGNVFSFYISGGEGNRRLDAPSTTGGSGTVCVMPEGHTSAWHIADRCRFVHLYMPADRLGSAFAEVHDKDARTLSLPEATFGNLPEFAGPLMILARAAESSDVIMADMAVAELVAQLGVSTPVLRGGLPPRSLRCIEEFVEANLGRTIRLADLADIAGLSQFHFCRMFKASRGLSPNAWITFRRICRARIMLQKQVPVLQAAVDCGFSSQSHFSRVFRAELGTTPASYKRLFSRTRK